MAIPVEIQQALAAKFEAVFPHLDERQRRLPAGAEARGLSHGGIRVVAKAAGMREGTVARGVAELESGEEPLGRARRPGGGRKKAADVDAGLRPALMAMVEPDVRGDPMSPLRWTTRSTRTLAAELTRAGHPVSADTVGRGAAELEAGIVVDGRVRARGAGRKPAEQTDPELWPALDKLVDPESRGDPMSRLRWTTRSTVKLADELTAHGHRVGPDTVARLLKDHDYSLQGNAKTIEGKQHPDRDGQFRYINEQARAHAEAGDPVISVDAEKKEQVGQYASPGRAWRPRGEPARVRDHDFPDADEQKAIPYGIYDLAANTGWVNVGTDRNTAEFAVESIRRWWKDRGSGGYPAARRLLITADAGGSNSHRSRVFKAELAALAAETNLDITVCHFPPGTSKWNKIEHRLFSHISSNWRGKP